MRILAPPLFVSLAAAQTPWTIQRLPDTGQTRRYATAPGDDSAYLINPPKFARTAEGVVTDLVTGLDWQQTDGGQMKWDAAISYCQALTLGGVTGWRLPYAQELFTIQNHGTVNPSVDTTFFARTAAEYWWAVEPRADTATMAWAANAGGGIGAHPVTETVSAGGSKRFHARCVRHTATGTGVAEPYADNGDGTVTDNRTGLMWQKTEGAAAINWEDSFGYASTLRLGGYDDWRMPNIKELRSLHTDYRVRPSIDTLYFPDTAMAIFWSSTTQVGQNGATAWTLDFTNGVVSYNPKGDRLHLRSVRGGGGPRIAFGGIRNAASFGEGPLAEGEIVSIFGSEFAGGNSVLMNGVAAPVVAWQDGQINAVVPPAVAGASNVTVSIDRNPALVLPVAAAAPALFTANASGAGAAAAFNEDLTLNATSAPARRGAILVLYATGHGALRENGSPALPVEVRIGGLPCQLLYAGLVPGLPAGVLQLNVRIPVQLAAASAVEVELRLGELRSQPGVTVSLL